MLPTLETVDWGDVRMYSLLAPEGLCNHCKQIIAQLEPIILAAKGLPRTKWWLRQSKVYCDPICKELED